MLVLILTMVNGVSTKSNRDYYLGLTEQIEATLLSLFNDRISDQAREGHYYLLTLLELVGIVDVGPILLPVFRINLDKLH